MNAYWPPNTEQTKLINAVLRTIQADHYSRENDPHLDAEREYAAEQLALAARELVRAVDALSEKGQPVGWSEPKRRPELPEWCGQCDGPELARRQVEHGPLPGEESPRFGKCPRCNPYSPRFVPST
jgi:hypothetical protein